MTSMTFSLQPIFDTLFSSLPPRPIEQDELNTLISKAIEDSRRLGSAEICKGQWEFMLKDDVLTLAATEGDVWKQDEDAYYEKLEDRLDVALAFTEQGVCDPSFALSVVQDLLDTQTIASCSRIFSWIELHAKRLTVAMITGRGKTLVLLRSLNDLLRRTSKMGATTMFCGRILNFLGNSFPLAERSGVNLRGEYGPRWEGTAGMTCDASTSQDSGAVSSDDMQVDEPKEKDKDSLYNIFWSLQYPFAYPPLLAEPGAFANFQASVNKVLPVIKEATAKERAMMGSKASTGQPSLKRKREPEVVTEGNNNEYFFAKFLTSPELLDLEIADTHFRRQFIFQLLILLNHLLTFTKAAQATWVHSKNRTLQMDFTLEPGDAQWAQETINKAMDELRQTTPSGRTFAETVNVILERDKNWVKWKADLCPSFDKGPWYAEVDGKRVGFEEATLPSRKKMREPPEPWKHELGSESLTDIWQMGYRGLEDLRNPFSPGDMKDFVKKIKQEDARIALRRKQIKPREAPAKAEATLTPAPELSSPEANLSLSLLGTPKPVPTTLPGSPLHPSLPAKPGSSPAKSTAADVPPSSSTAPPPSNTVPAEPIVPPPLPTDPMISRYEENKQRLSWLALRVGRDQYLQHFGKIGTGDILMLMDEIDKERREKEEKEKEATIKVDSEPPASAEHSEAALATNVDNDRESQPNGDDHYGPNADSAQAREWEQAAENGHVGGSKREEDSKMDLGGDNQNITAI